jgi:hypothetical protein
MHNIEKNTSLLKKPFRSMPLGSILPKGWLKDQLQIQASGLTGHLDEFWQDVGPNSGWLGGTGESWERGPYYLDGLLPLAYLLEDDHLIEKVKKWVEWNIKSQQDNGQFGPLNNDDWWSRMVMLKVFIQHYEATKDDRVIPFMIKYFRYQLSMIKENPLQEWATARGGENIFCIYWLFEYTQEDWLLELAEIIFEQSIDWTEIFTNFPYKEKIASFDHRTHVVNVAMALKLPALYYLQSKSEKLKHAAKKGIEQLMKYHGQAQGMFSGDEWLAGTHPSQGTELCSVVEYMFSLQHLVQILGDVEWADRLEKAAFNALPATLKPDMWGHQYDQQVNQVACTLAKRNWTFNGDDSNLFGLEPHFGCCLANMHQGWPKFASSLWMETDDQGLAAISFAPSQVTTMINGVNIKINEETNYPFKDSIIFKFNLASTVQFPLKLRVPTWCENPLLSINGISVEIKMDQGFCIIDRVWSDEDIVEWTLPMNIKVVERPTGGVSIERGPLVYALKIGEEWKKLKGTDPYADWEVYPTTSWNYGLLLNDKKQAFRYKETLTIPNQPFSSEGAPVQLIVKGKQVSEWRLNQNSAATPPKNPSSDQPEEEIILIPYGCTNIRIAEFPVIKN